MMKLWYSCFTFY